MIDELHSFKAIDYRQSVGSTQDEMRILARAGAPEFTVVLAETQTAGRGRRGKVWHAAPYSGLYGSVSTGIAQDLDSSGGLIVQTSTGSRLLYAGEVSLKRA